MKKLTIYFALLLVLLSVLSTVLAQRDSKYQRIQYDSQGRLIQEPHPDLSGYITYEYDDYGLLAKKQEILRSGDTTIFYYKNGTIYHSEVLNKDGYIRSIGTYDDTGKLLLNEEYNSSGEKNGRYQMYYYHDNGALETEERYVDNLIDKLKQYDTKGNMIRQDEYKNGALHKSLRYVYEKGVGYREDTYSYKDGETLEASVFYNTNGSRTRIVHYDNGLAYREDFYNYEKTITHYYIYTYDNRGDMIRKTHYTGAGYLTEETVLYEDKSVVTYINSFHGTQKLGWMKLKGLGSCSQPIVKSITCYLPSGDYISIHNVLEERDGNTVTWTSESDPTASIVLTYDNCGNVISRTVTGGAAHKANGDPIKLTTELLAQFNTSPEYPEQ